MKSKKSRLLVSICPTAFVVSPGTKILNNFGERKIKKARLFDSISPSSILYPATFNMKTEKPLIFCRFMNPPILRPFVTQCSWDEYRTKTWSLDKSLRQEKEIRRMSLRNKGEGISKHAFPLLFS